VKEVCSGRRVRREKVRKAGRWMKGRVCGRKGMAGKEAGRVMKVGWPLEDKIGP
jgi:hypothetical protein